MPLLCFVCTLFFLEVSDCCLFAWERKRRGEEEKMNMKFSGQVGYKDKKIVGEGKQYDWIYCITFYRFFSSMGSWLLII